MLRVQSNKKYKKFIIKIIKKIIKMPIKKIAFCTILDSLITWKLHFKNTKREGIILKIIIVKFHK